VAPPPSSFTTPTVAVAAGDVLVSEPEPTAEELEQCDLAVRQYQANKQLAAIFGSIGTVHTLNVYLH
jgi:hypothetical protein